MSANEENPFFEKIKFQGAKRQMNFSRKYQHVHGEKKEKKKKQFIIYSQNLPKSKGQFFYCIILKQQIHNKIPKLSK